MMMKEFKDIFDYSLLKQINDLCDNVQKIDLSKEKDIDLLVNIFKQVAQFYIQMNLPVVPLLLNKILNLKILTNSKYISKITSKDVQHIVQLYKYDAKHVRNVFNLDFLLDNVVDTYFLTSLIDKNKYIDFMKNNFNKIEWYNIGLLFINKLGLIAFDADNNNTTEFLMSIDEFKNTLKVKTKKGYHFYFQIKDPENIPENFIELIFYKDYHNISIDLRLNKGYTILPPSRIFNHVYKWEINEIIMFKWNELQKLMKDVKTKCFFNSLTKNIV